MLDANSFDYIHDHGIDPRKVSQLGDIFITNIQHGELLSIPDARRRKCLLGVLSAINPTVTPASVGVWLKTRGPSAPAAYASEATDSEASGVETSELAKRFYGGSRRAGNWKDAAIGEAASLEGFILVTDDKQFRRNAIALGVTTLTCEEAFSGLDITGHTPA